MRRGERGDVLLLVKVGADGRVDGVDVVAEVHAVLDRMAAFSGAVRSGEWKGFVIDMATLDKG